MQTLNSLKFIKTLMATSLLMASISNAQSATVQFSAAPANILPGSTFTLDILASGFNSLIGGGLAISVGNPTVLQLNSATFNSVIWDASYSNDGTVSGADIINLGFGNSVPVDGAFAIGSLSFTASASGSSTVNLAADTFNGGFQFAGSPDVITFIPSNITVAPASVPVPAAFWLLFSALGLVGLNFKNRA